MHHDGRRGEREVDLPRSVGPGVVIDSYLYGERHSLPEAASEIRRDSQNFSSGKCAGVRINGRKALVFQVVYMPTLSIRAENVEIRTGFY